MLRSRLGSAVWFGLTAIVVLHVATASAIGAEEGTKPIRALLVVGGCCHDYQQQKDLITRGVSARANVQWTIAYDAEKGTGHPNPIFENPDWAKGYDVVVHDECSAGISDLAVIDRVLKPHREGLPAVVLHCAMHSFRSEGWREGKSPWFEFTGLPSTGHGPHLPIAVEYVAKDCPITKGFENWTTGNEELYNNSIGKPLDTARALAVGKQTVKGKDGNEVIHEGVVVWTNLYNGKARVFGTTLGHSNATVDDPRHLDLITRGLLWAVDKLDEAHLRPAAKVLLDE
ncbi:MAG: ThuA domain-containing protein [Patescibacteria group bacterium]|nr:ThuA domain-containing protein [Patescibacteria group bacterium]